MEWFAGGIGLAGIAGLSLLGYLLYQAMDKAVSRADALGEEKVRGAKLEGSVEQWKSSSENFEKKLDGAKETIEREVAARNLVEEQRDKAIDDLAKHGDPRGVAAALRHDIGRLRSLSSVPEVSKTTAPSTTEDR